MAVKSALYNVVFKACQKASRNLKRDFGEVENLQVSRKGPRDFVSTADLQAERVLKEELNRARPEFGFLMEESGEVKTDDPRGRRWIVDPLDGTLNFLHGIPHFAISVAAEENGEIVFGAVYQPLTDEFFWAEKGQGAYLNDRRLRVSGRRNLQDAVLATGIPVTGLGGDHDRFLAYQRAVMDNCAGVRRFGAAALDLAWVAAGRFDGFWEMRLNPWDIAAGILLVKEAGGYVSDFQARANVLESGDVVAVNDHLHGPILKLFKNAKPKAGAA
ncbi:MAG: inositol monophosphatase family protein [Thalassobaculum sp.]|uniref:inositol monophosphatase family protein n=1 Tax=Thalassobaculum sp. TaxID=2022740 RepID=UPI0032EFF8D5